MEDKTRMNPSAIRAHPGFPLHFLKSDCVVQKIHIQSQIVTKFHIFHVGWILNIMYMRGGGVMATAERLRRLRKERNLSQDEVAHALGLDRTTYVKYENGGSIKRNLQRLADFFEVSTDYLLGRDDASTIVREEETPGCAMQEMRYAVSLGDSLTLPEKKHIKKYRMLTLEQQAALDCLLEHYFRSRKLKE